MKKNYSIIFSFAFFILAILFWDYIKLPYNPENNIIGEYFYKKKSPSNNVLRFIFAIVLPSIIYLFFYIKFQKKSFNINVLSKNYFLVKKKTKENDSIKIYFIFFIILIIFELLSLDFRLFINPIDPIAESAFLIPPINYLQTGELFKSTFYDYGLIPNNILLLYKFFFKDYSIGSLIFIKIFFIFLIKFFLILISRKIVIYSNLNDLNKKLIFIIFTFFIISLPNYYDFYSYFEPRSSLFLFFIYLLGTTICDEKYKNLNFFIVGLFSAFSAVWWIDIGAFINTLILLTIIFLIIHNEIKSFYFLCFGIVCGWLILSNILTYDEFRLFIHQLKIIYSSTWDYLLGIEYKKPFSDNSGRWTKAILLIYFTSILVVNFNFSKKLNINRKLKIFISLIFLASILGFKSALLRSDSYHLKYSSGLYTIVFVFIILFYFFYFLKKIKIINYIFSILKKNKYYLNLIFFITVTIFSFNILSKSNSFRNSESNEYKIFHNNLSNLLNAKDENYISEEIKDVLKYYKSLSLDDNCLQIFSDDYIFSYFLRKKTCTKFYAASSIINGVTESQFLNEFKNSLPEFILFESKIKILSNHNNMPEVLKFIKNKYNFYSDYKGYIFYRLKN